jgi:hypothetical protein
MSYSIHYLSGRQAGCQSNIFDVHLFCCSGGLAMTAA